MKMLSVVVSTVIDIYIVLSNSVFYRLIMVK